MQNHTNRKANFACAIALKFPTGEIKAVESKIYGTILTKMTGTQGFGYDPIFHPENEPLSFGEMPPQQKNQISHRYKALLKAKKLQTLLSPKNQYQH